MAELYIIPECYVDTNLIETLVPTAKGYNHQKGCNNVVKVMKEKLSDKFAVGIVDKDKRQVSYVNEFEEIGHTDSLYFYKHPDKAHFLIMIDPAVDRFIIKTVASFLGYCGLKHSERYRTHCRRKPIPKSNAYAYSTVLAG